MTHLKRHWYRKRLKVGRKGDDREWDGWMASLTQQTWVWVNSESWWWTGKSGLLQSMGSQRVGHDWATELNRTETRSLDSGAGLDFQSLAIKSPSCDVGISLVMLLYPPEESREAPPPPNWKEPEEDSGPHWWWFKAGHRLGALCLVGDVPEPFHGWL